MKRLSVSQYLLCCLLAFSHPVLLFGQTPLGLDNPPSSRGLTSDQLAAVKDAAEFIYSRLEDCEECEEISDVDGNGQVDREDVEAMLGIPIRPPDPPQGASSTGFSGTDTAEDLGDVGPAQDFFPTPIVYVHGSPYAIWTMQSSGGLQMYTGFNGVDPTLSPDGTRIAFTDGGDIWVVKRDFSEINKVIDDGWLANDWAPAWSPDGQRLAFVKSGDIWTAELQPDGTWFYFKRLTHVSNQGGTDSNPSWSGDGNYIAFERGTPDEFNPDIYYMTEDGYSETQITDTPDISEIRPDWHPFLPAVVYSRETLVDGDWDLYVTFFPGAGPFTLAITPDPFYRDWNPSFSPDGWSIVFTRKYDLDTYASDICTIALNGTDFENHTPSIGDDLQARNMMPDWKW